MQRSGLRKKSLHVDRIKGENQKTEHSAFSVHEKGPESTNYKIHRARIKFSKTTQEVAVVRKKNEA